MVRMVNRFQCCISPGFAWLLAMMAACLTGIGAEPLGSTAAVRLLPRPVAATELPVDLHGTVIFSYGPRGSNKLVIEQDGTGIFLNIGQAVVRHATDGPLQNGNRPAIGMGSELHIRGVTGAGQYAPVIHAREITVLGTGSLPPPPPMVLGEVLTGSKDCQRLELEGVVQGVELPTPSNPDLRLELAVPTGRLLVECFEPGSWTRENLLGATVRMTAVAMTYFNIRGEILGVHFLVGRAGDIAITKAAPAAPFEVPVVPLTALQPFSPHGPNLGRVQISGQITLSRPGRFFYLEEAGRAVRVFTRDPSRFRPGERVTASGFIELHQSFADLREAEVRRIGDGELVEPPLMTHKRLMEESEWKWGRPAPVDFNGRLIAVEGILNSIEPMEDGRRRLFITTEGETVTATLDGEGGGAELDTLAAGSAVRVAGVCELQFPSTQMLTDFPNPTGFSLLLRSAADLTVLSAAPWWTPQRLWVLLAGVAGLLAMVLVWNLLLRRLVKQRGLQLAAEMRARDREGIEFDATLRERTRLAADLHDTLEQALTGLSFQLDTSRVLSAKAPAASARHLDLGRQLLTRSREDLRRSIWNLRARELDGHSLAEALRSTAVQAAEGRSIRIAVEETGEAHALPEFIAGNLLLLAQEAITNAIKHGNPGTINVGVHYGPEQVTLDVKDDGNGFDPAAAPGLHEGHFGLQGMRERANRLDGRIEIESQPGGGTRITVRVPLPAPPGDPIESLVNGSRSSPPPTPLTV
jgi:signal transduction histidine kinase